MLQKNKKKKEPSLSISKKLHHLYPRLIAGSVFAVINIFYPFFQISRLVSLNVFFSFPENTPANFLEKFSPAFFLKLSIPKFSSILNNVW